MYQVLFVDDDEAICYLVSKFSCWGRSEFTLKDTAENGRAAMELLRKNHYDLVITDIRMPVVDGMELLKQIGREYPQTAVVLSSTYSDFEYAREGMRLGALDFIPKPLVEKKLEETFQYLIPELKKRNGFEAAIPDADGYVSHQAECICDALLHGRVDELEPLLRETVTSGRVKPGQIPAACGWMLEYLWGRLRKEFPWLEEIAAPDPDIRTGQAASMETALTGLGELEELVQTFRLDKQDEVVKRISLLMANHLAENDCLDQIAREMEFSRDYVRAMFKGRTGFGLNEYLTVMRMEYAQTLLRTTNLKVYEIAEKTGYGTIDYFTRLFKHYTGETPLRYRKHGKRVL